MNRYLLDTCVCVDFLRNGSGDLVRRIVDAPQEAVFLCSNVKAELAHGAMRTRNPESALRQVFDFASHFESLPFDDESARIYGLLRARLDSLGRPGGSNDMLIAAIALQHGLTLVTSDKAGFSTVEGLQIEDWNPQPN